MQMSSLISFIKNHLEERNLTHVGKIRCWSTSVFTVHTQRGSPGRITVVGASPERVTHTCSVTLVPVYMCANQCTSTSPKETVQNTNSWGHLNYLMQQECIRTVCNPTGNTNFLLNVHQIALVCLTDAFFPVGLGFVCFVLRKADFI